MSEQVLPFYLVCDESGSMGGPAGGVETINASLPELHAEVASNPIVADKTRFCLIGFSDTAEVLLQLSDLGELEQMPGLTPKGTTNFGEAFRLLKTQISSDVELLKRDGHKVYRPVVFFLSDGQPTDNGWEKNLDELTDTTFAYRPNIVAFGIGDSDPNTISRVANFRAFIQRDGVSPAKALHEFASSLTKSIVKSGSTADPATGTMQLQVPDKIDGFESLPLDTL